MTTPVGREAPIVIAGSTGSGKSALAVSLATRVGGEIICADSRQVYDRMRIVSAGPTPKEEAAVKHVGYHVVDPCETYDAGRFVSETDARVKDAIARGKLPILVGGTGMYLRSWRFGLEDVPDKDPELRARLERELKDQGLPVLFARLQRVDPETAAKIGPSDPHRAVRALELFEQTGRPASALRRSFFDAPPRFKAHWILLEAAQPWLSQRIHARAHRMYEAGLLEEACNLEAYLGAGHRLLSTMGTEEALAVESGAMQWGEAIERTAIRQRQYARRQRIWFRKEPWWQRLKAEELASLGPEEAAKTLLPLLNDDG